jgi:uncharacterized protein YoaH (UPF0181 family)
MKILIIIISFMAGCAALAGIARINGVPLCSLTNSCGTNLLEENRELKKIIEQNTIKISHLNAEIEKNTADLNAAITKGKRNIDQARIAVEKLDKLNMEGMNNGEKLRAVAKLLDQIRMDLLNITD